MKACVNCEVVKPLSEFAFRARSKDGRAFRCRACINWAKVARQPRVPVHLLHLIQRRGRWICIPAEVVREVLRTIDPNCTPSSVAAAMGRDEASGRKIFCSDWIGEEKIDRLLVAFDCPHLWLEPPLNEYRLAILEYEELILARQELEAVA